MHRNLIGALAPVLGAASLVASAPRMASAQAPKVYYACYVPSTGTVYRIKEPDTRTQCESSTKKGVTTQHIEFSWTDGGGALRVTDPAGGDLTGPLGSPTVAKLLGRALGSGAPANGSVLTWDAAANQWQAKMPPSGGGGTTDHGALTGLADDDHPQYLLSEGVRRVTNGFAVTGTFGVGAAPGPLSSTESRLMWNPSAATFFAGFTSSGDSPGVGSVALGLNPSAEGYGAVALGSNSRAPGEGAVALSGGVARGVRSLAVAGGATIVASQSAIAMGNTALAYGVNSVAIGNATQASGDFAVAIGNRLWATGERSMAIGSSASTNGRVGAFAWGDASSSTVVSAVANNQFVARAAQFWLGNDNNVTSSLGRFIETSTGAYLSSGGTWTNSSDSAKKTAFQDVSADSILAKLAALPVRTWSYRDEDSTVRHMGPTAQEFRAAFALGQSETAIATVDADGVSLAAIKALVARNERLRGDLDGLRRRNGELRDELDSLGERVRTLEAALSSVAGGPSSRR